MPAIQAVVQGRVQGVGFRWFVVREARQRGLTGRVRNLPRGGEVEVYAEGERPALESFIRRLEQGPVLARVTHVQLEWLETGDRFESFDVAY